MKRNAARRLKMVVRGANDTLPESMLDTLHLLQNGMVMKEQTVRFRGKPIGYDLMRRARILERYGYVTIKKWEVDGTYLLYQSTPRGIARYHRDVLLGLS